ncbi:sulfatase family protein [Aliiruegeria sabulilitoris]|uniref:sulfatase family protein n=1 Tax=Aliiruegeria sabulilitoris TaxID=1510458 RepID=UPI00083644FC|nr:sulfatase-like hydrolase/transferase [Aliiruegeria sabulilitoris]NDR58001.1 sulfatase-like hydrolase/transferase [Pseudoruegeria sp. M32A2M]
MTKRPNILLITTDQQHFSALGAVNPAIRTPNLDRLCAEGTRFDRAYCPAPTCTPSRASIITGLMPSQHGAWTIGCKLPEEVPTLGAALSQAGYATGLIGKAHFQPLAGDGSLEKQPILRNLDFWRGFHGPFYGFDHIELCRNHADEAHVGQHYAAWMEENGLADWKEYFQPLPGETASKAPEMASDAPYWAREGRVWALPEEMHYTTWIGERSMAFLDRAAEADAPFLLWTSFPDPHPPYTVPEPWATMYDPADMEPGRLTPGEHDRNPPHFAKTQQAAPDFAGWHEPYEAHGCASHLYPEDALKKDMAVYYGMMSFLDHEIGRILDHLEQLGLAEDTLIVFTTDHGHFLGQHGLVAKGPFHYEDMLRLPFIVRWPGQVPAGHVSEALQSLVDLMPSFMDAAGLGAPDNLQGISQLPVWTGAAESVRDFALCENRHNTVRPHVTSYIDARYKISVYREGDDGEIFDLQEDPGEIRNLWGDPQREPLKRDLLHRMVQAMLASEPMKTPRVAQA